MILFRRNFQCSVSKVCLDPQGRYILMEIEIDGTSLVLTNLYAPNTDSPQFFTKVLNETAELDNTNMIVAGDFNFAIDPTLDRRFSHANNDKARDRFLAHADEMQLTDAWCTLNPQSKQYSCCRPNSNPNSLDWQKFSRLDMFFISQGLMTSVTKSVMQAGYQSDHSFVILDLELSNERKGPGYWKLNATHLYDKQYLDAVNALIEENMQNVQLAPDLQWQKVKGILIEFSKRYSKDKAKAKKQELNDLESQLDKLKIIVEELPYPSENVIHKYKELHTKRQSILQIKSDGAFVRSRTKYYQQGERSSKYFFSLEKSNAAKKTMKQLKLNDGSYIKNSKQLLKEQRKFYSLLYSARQATQFNLKNETDKKLTDNDKAKLDQPFTLAEFSVALNNMPNNKTPGLDGLTAEFYKMFWSKLGQIYTDAIMFIKQSGSMWLSARRGIITLIPKKNKDTNLLTNWRPLTMLTCDYKILAKAIALRMQSVLDYLINPDQTGYMKGRNIVENIVKVKEIVQYTHNTHTPAVVMTLDFFKCFDSVEHSAIWGSLRYFNFGEEFISWSKLLFVDFELCTQNNGHFSQFFPSQRSIHQGCPAAGYFYLLVAQILHDKLTLDTRIKGITIHGVEQLLSQFADDTTMFLTFDPIVLASVVEVLDVFERNTGLTVNYNKTNLYRIGSLFNTDAKLYTTRPFNWTNNPIELLGVFILTKPDETLCVQLNYIDTLESVTSIVETWKLRNLTLSGKVLIVNSLIASLLVYKMQVLPDLNADFLSRFNRIIVNFLWNGKKPKIATNLLMRDKSEGGLRLVSLKDRQTALKAQWVTKINSASLWSTLFHASLPFNIGTQLWNCNLKESHVKCFIDVNVNPFWFTILQSWCRYNFTVPDTKQKILSQFLWCNSHILVAGKPFISIAAINTGLHYLKQIVKHDGRFKSYEQINTDFPNVFTWFDYAQLLSSIPIRWKTALNDDDESSPQLTGYQKIQNESKIANIVYTRLIDCPNAMVARCNRWNRKLSCDMSPEHFCKQFVNIYKATVATKYRDFQYRLLTGAIVTNRLLFLWKIEETDLCSFCKQAVEDELHLFATCSFAQKCWYALQQYILKNDRASVSSQLTWNAKNIIFSSVHPTPGSVINFLVIIVKQFIYRARCQDATPLPMLIEDEIDKVYHTELSIAKKLDKMHRHAVKWSALRDIEVPQNQFIAQYVQQL